jgi:hypothetical protein
MASTPQRGSDGFAMSAHRDELGEIENNYEENNFALMR